MDDLQQFVAHFHWPDDAMHRAIVEQAVLEFAATRGLDVIMQDRES